MIPPCQFCDTPYALKNGVKMSVTDVVKKIKSYRCRNICVTGGEPLLQQKELIQVIEKILGPLGLFWFFEVETNGMITPLPRMLELIDHWTVSPKLSNAGVKPYKIGDWFFNDDKRGTSCLKFVIDNQKDLLEVQEYLLNNGLEGIEREAIFLMPQAITTEEHNRKLPFIIEFAKKFGYRVSPRLQILTWGNKRGV